MEFTFSLQDILPDQITVLKKGRFNICEGRRENLWNVRVKNLEQVIDQLGFASAKAQGLRAPITTAPKFRTSQHTLYIMKDKGTADGSEAVVGILKVGRKHLFLADFKGHIHEVEPLCVLDFYVHESRQRSGYGQQLFQHLLKVEEKSAHELAIDRPSAKFLSFLRKHYSLCSYPKQANNFVVFDHFFTTSKDSKHNANGSLVNSKRSSNVCPTVGPTSFSLPTSRHHPSSTPATVTRESAFVLPLHMRSGSIDRVPASTAAQSQTSNNPAVCRRAGHIGGESGGGNQSTDVPKAELSSPASNQAQSDKQCSQDWKHPPLSLSSKVTSTVPTIGSSWTVNGVLSRINNSSKSSAPTSTPYLGLRQMNSQYASPPAQGNSWKQFSKYQLTNDHRNTATDARAPHRPIHYGSKLGLKQQARPFYF